MSCNKCFEQICEKAHQFLIENFLDDIQEQTPRLKIFGKTVEENLVNIAKHIAINSWENPVQHDFEMKARLNGRFKDKSTRMHLLSSFTMKTSSLSTMNVLITA